MNGERAPTALIDELAELDLHDPIAARSMTFDEVRAWFTERLVPRDARDARHARADPSSAGLMPKAVNVLWDSSRSRPDDRPFPVR